MREMGWTWKELEETPQLVKKIQWDLITIRRRVEKEQAEAQKDKAERDARRARQGH